MSAENITEGLRRIYLNGSRKPTPAQIQRWVKMVGKDHIWSRETIDLYPPTQADIREKQDDETYTKR